MSIFIVKKNEISVAMKRSYRVGSLHATEKRLFALPVDKAFHDCSEVAYMTSVGIPFRNLCTTPPVIAARSKAKSLQSTHHMDPATSRRMTSSGCLSYSEIPYWLLKKSALKLL